MFNELTEELLDVTATSKGHRDALYAVKIIFCCCFTCCCSD
jgi:hypothetical protein